jgi:hypothetical protein
MVDEMSILGGPNGFVENQTNYLLFAFTNEEIGEPNQFATWWQKFADISSIAGLTEGIRVIKDLDQRVGHMPKWKFLVVFGFSGDAAQLSSAINAHTIQGDSELWFYESISNLIQKDWTGDETCEHFFLALTNPVQGREADFEEWYENYHTKDCVAVSVYRSGRRYKLIAESGAYAPWEYLAFYRFVGSTLAMHDILIEELAAMNAPETDALNKEYGAWIYSAL